MREEKLQKIINQMVVEYIAYFGDSTVEDLIEDLQITKQQAEIALGKIN